jgi:hypothetical protein
MKFPLSLFLFLFLLSGCGSIGAYTESNTDTKVNFFEYNSKTDDFINKKASLKVVETGLVSGRTLLYSANGSNSFFYKGKKNHHVTYSLWINESEVDDVEFAIEKYRFWQDQANPKQYLAVKPINEYVSEWMNGITFKFGLFSSKQGESFMSICYEFNVEGSCTFTYMIDEKNVELLANDLDKFKLHLFE